MRHMLTELGIAMTAVALAFGASAVWDLAHIAPPPPKPLRQPWSRAVTHWDAKWNTVTSWICEEGKSCRTLIYR